MNMKKLVLIAVIAAICIIVATLSFISSSQPSAVFTYIGENTVPQEITNFPSSTDKPYYSFDLKITNINVEDGIGTPGEQALQQLVSKYPQLATRTIPGTNETTLQFDVTSFSGSLTHQCVVFFANSNLTNEQIQSLTTDLNNYFSPAIIQWMK